MNERLAAARLAQTEARAKLAETQATAKLLSEEVVISHGKIEDLAHSMVKKLKPMMEAIDAWEKVPESERSAKEAELSVQVGADIMDVVPLQRTVLKLEDRPADAAHFFAIAHEEAIKLPIALRPLMESTLLADFDQLKNDGLIFSMRPKKNLEAWIARRAAASETMAAHLKALLPPEARNHPIFKTSEGFLGGVTIAEFSYLGNDAKATPQPPATKP